MLVLDRLQAGPAQNPNDVAGAVSSALRGRSLADFKGNDRQIPVKMRFSEEDRAELDDVNNYQVRIEDGRYASVGALTRPAMLKSQSSINRNNKNRRKISFLRERARRRARRREFSPRTCSRRRGSRTETFSLSS